MEKKTSPKPCGGEQWKGLLGCKQARYWVCCEEMPARMPWPVDRSFAAASLPVTLTFDF